MTDITTTALTEDAAKFPLAMRALHWAMTLLMIGLLALRIYMAGIPLESSDKLDLYPWHRSFGILVFILVAVRLIVRWISRSRIPGLPPAIPACERLAAKAVQVFFYGAMIAMPILGYIASSAVPEFPDLPPLTSFWFFGAELPLAPVEKNYDTTIFFITIHKYLGYAIVVALVAHVGGALKHRFFDTPGTDVLSKML
jgi:cytochrome b561